VRASSGPASTVRSPKAGSSDTRAAPICASPRPAHSHFPGPGVYLAPCEAPRVSTYFVLPSTYFVFHLGQLTVALSQFPLCVHAVSS
jgi:hypothetical protein